MTEASFLAYKLDDQVGFLLRKAYQRHMAICAERIGGRLTAVQFSILHRLAAEPTPVSQNALGRMVAMDAATTKGVVLRLKERGLIVSRVDKDDKRRHMLSTTEEGRALLAEVTPIMAEITQQTLAPLEPYERATLTALLQKIC
ncbi:MarR family winged helix-turn-helix transcriptional regulator [Paracoccus shanxieyensis]|uniref:MarR family transcriptional regulator n=1 Tax=Paracoccus shanxieyensis TaxID=2675752 RepID=A0A6L6IU74_9RHOB|nr:MarR family winged helix-turn-helix transcriptional regulator [Paracoccus shanxieyensis]MTH64085.1 MarR family transcriptional regulator [Paracoccus shanxieyensis]MTH86874.1 MarR family transcriptional regulator [Paracoccus shanxieyensis]